MFLLIILGLLVSNTYSETIYCTGHDACKNKIWNGEYDIFCGASNSERTCKSTTLNCGANKDCTIKTQGSGHDAYQNSIVNAKESNSFKLTCQASGLRDCQSITIWCPQSTGSTCECVSCPSSVNMKCVSGVSCNSISNANIDYVEADEYQIPDKVWKKDTSHQGKRPDCHFVKIASGGNNYLWNNLNKCKEKCINEPTGKCNMVSRYGEGIKTTTEDYHCRFYACEDPYNFNWITQIQWGNYASSCHTYIIPIRHFTLESRIQNKTIYKNETIYNYKTRYIDRYINKTRENIINKTRYIDRYINKTRYIDRYINKTRYIDRYINKTRENIINIFNNITRILERNITNYFNKTIINDLCNVITNPDIISSNNMSKNSYDNIVNKEISITNTTCGFSSNLSDREIIILILSLLIILLLIFRICYVDFCEHCDYKLNSKNIITKSGNVTVQLPSWDDCESLERMPSENIIVTNAIPISG